MEVTFLFASTVLRRALIPANSLSNRSKAICWGVKKSEANHSTSYPKVHNASHTWEAVNTTIDKQNWH
jgi:hypothetical protein